MAELFTSDDYPAPALDKSEQGIVGILVKVDAARALSDCLIERSSGSAALDAQTCRIVWLRAKFKPVEDARGRRIEPRD